MDQTIIYLLFFSWPSVLGLGLIFLACYKTRRPGWLITSSVVGLALHLVSTQIMALPNLGIGEPSAEAFVEARTRAVYYFFMGFPFLMIPFGKIFYLRLN